MSSHKLDRTSQDMKRALADIVRDLKDPRISMLLSIVRVEISGDMSYAKIFVSAIEGYEKTLESVKGLKNAKGYIKKELSAKVKMRKMPELTFIADNSIEHGSHIARIIENFPEFDDEETENED